MDKDTFWKQMPDEAKKWLFQTAKECDFLIGSITGGPLMYRVDNLDESDEYDAACDLSLWFSDNGLIVGDERVVLLTSEQLEELQTRLNATLKAYLEEKQIPRPFPY